MAKLKARELDQLLKAAVRAAKAAAKIQLKYFAKAIPEIREKEGAGLVTRADLESERAIVRILNKAHPGFDFLAEEGTSPRKSRARKVPASGRWHIDPLDGTTNFVHGFPAFCISIGAEWEGELVLGVIYAPVFKDLYTATLGGGAFCNGRRIRVSRTREIEKALLTTGFTPKKGPSLHQEIERFECMSRRARAIRRPGSAALDLAYTARGVFDGFWEQHLAEWDVAAGTVLVREAGGAVTGFGGQEFSLSGREILASGKELHPELVRALLDPCVI